MAENIEHHTGQETPDTIRRDHQGSHPRSLQSVHFVASPNTKRWESPGAWVDWKVPHGTGDVFIPEGSIMVVRANNLPATGRVEVEAGTLRLNAGVNTKLDADHLQIAETGSLEVSALAGKLCELPDMQAVT